VGQRPPVPRPRGFSVADALAAALHYTQPPCPAPHAVSWAVSGPAPDGGRFLDAWLSSLTVGQPLPELPLALGPGLRVTVDLEGTYTKAAADAYLE
jgi:hypothetical protein